METKPAVCKLKYGNTNTFLIRGSRGGLLVDTDYAGTLPALYRAMKEQSVQIGDIGWVLATHYHPDHIGLVSELMSHGVRLLLVDAQIPYVRFSDEIFRREGRTGWRPIDISDADVVTIGESRAVLERMGIRGEIISTPSHSPDSVSLALDDGWCFVGDLEPLEYLDGYEDNAALKRDWDLVMGRRPRVICYAHANEKRL